MGVEVIKTDSEQTLPAVSSFLDKLEQFKQHGQQVDTLVRDSNAVEGAAYAGSTDLGSRVMEATSQVEEKANPRVTSIRELTETGANQAADTQASLAKIEPPTFA